MQLIVRRRRNMLSYSELGCPHADRRLRGPGSRWQPIGSRVMASIQIACPHCASKLSFGHAVQAGAVLSCLICNRTFTIRNGKSATVQPAVRSAPQGTRSESSGGAGRVVGGLLLAAIALLMLGGLGYLFWANVLADRLAGDGKDLTHPVGAQGPNPDAAAGNGQGIPPPPIVNTNTKNSN